MNKSVKVKSIIYAFLTVVFYAINIPISKILLKDIGSTMMASLLYLGAGIGIGILSMDDIISFAFSYGSLFVLLATICWGFDNNCTRMISSKDTFYSVNPFIGAFLGFMFLNETLNLNYFIALLIMILGTLLIIKDTLLKSK